MDNHGQITGTTTEVSAGQTVEITLIGHDKNGLEIETKITAVVGADGTYQAEVPAEFMDGDIQALPTTLKSLVKVYVSVVSVSIRKTKTLLKFNFVVDKTLNGVINMVTSTGYKRLEKVGDEYKTGDAAKAQHYAHHFKKFLVEA